jgi:uncharacterized membrane protein YtjA (UPF0391 family)
VARPSTGTNASSAAFRPWDTRSQEVRRVCEKRAMLTWAIIFLILALIAGAFGFTDLAKGAAAIAKVLFFIFLALFVILVALSLLGIAVT